MGVNGRAASTGRAATALVVSFLGFDALGKLLEVPQVVNRTAQLGYSTDVVFGLGLTLLVCVVAYVVPSTSVVGASLLTGYLGGAVATHLRVGDPALTHILFPVYVSVLAWGALWLRNPHLRPLLTGWIGSRRTAARNRGTSNRAHSGGDETPQDR